MFLHSTVKLLTYFGVLIYIYIYIYIYWLPHCASTYITHHVYKYVYIVIPNIYFAQLNMTDCWQTLETFWNSSAISHDARKVRKQSKHDPWILYKLQYIPLLSRHSSSSIYSSTKILICSPRICSPSGVGVNKSSLSTQQYKALGGTFALGISLLHDVASLAPHTSYNGPRRGPREIK